MINIIKHVVVEAIIWWLGFASTFGGTVALIVCQLGSHLQSEPITNQVASPISSTEKGYLLQICENVCQYHVTSHE